MTSVAEHTQEERLLATISHASVIASGIGIIVGLVVYITEKEKSLWTAWQGLQAAVYQLIGMVIVVFVWLGWTALLILIPYEKSSDTLSPAFWATMCCPFLITGAWIIYGCYGAIRAWSGADFRYIGIGRILEGVVGNGD